MVLKTTAQFSNLLLWGSQKSVILSILDDPCGTVHPDSNPQNPRNLVIQALASPTLQINEHGTKTDTATNALLPFYVISRQQCHGL